MFDLGVKNKHLINRFLVFLVKKLSIWTDICYWKSMVLVIASLLLIINIVGLLNRKKVWSKIFLVSQLFFIGGSGVLFIVNNQGRGLEAKRKQLQEKNQTLESATDRMAKTAKEMADSADTEKNAQDGLKVKGF